MFISRYSALYITFIALCLVGLLFWMPYRASAEISSQSVNWIDASITPNFSGEVDWSSEVESMYRNIPCSSETAHIWAWQDSGWNRTKILSPQPKCMTAGMSSYVGFRHVLPFGSFYWHELDVSDYYHAWTLPNAGTNGMALITNSYANYAQNMPSELYYTDDVTAMFGALRLDGVGNIIRSPSKQFDRKLTFPDGRVLAVNDKGSVSYSENGKWMYVNKEDVAQLRVKVSDFSVFSFAPGAMRSYATHTSISNSGNTVATYSHDTGLKLYDLTRCDVEKPDYGSRNCASRDITQVARDAFQSIQASTPVYIMGVKFQTESRLRLFMRYEKGAEIKFGFLDLEVETGEQPVRYLALGDSFSSGEGVYNYRSVTDFYADANNYNLCHQSLLSYPYLIKNSMGLDWFGSVACSGATQGDVVAEIGESDGVQAYIDGAPQSRMGHITHTNLINIATNTLPGYIPQASVLANHNPSVVTISIGGNDIGFGDIVTACIVNKYFRKGQSCNSDRFDREQVANSIDAEIPRLAATLASVKQNLSGGQKLYVVGYPKIVNYTNMLCPLNVPMNQNEREFADSLVDYLNEAVRIASNRAGARFLDMSSAFVNSEYDYRLCGNGDARAVNGLSLDKSSSRKPGDAVAHESFHPNRLGHNLLSKHIRALTNDFSLHMPSPTGTCSTPDPSFRIRLVGDAIITNPNKKVNYIADSIPDMIINTGINTMKITTNVPGAIMQNTKATIQLHSTPITIGEAIVTPKNTIEGTFSIPDTVTPGYHQLHVTYMDSVGQEYDLYKHVLVKASLDDYDGDGTMNIDETCLFGDGSGVDSDEDGVDDACDGEYVKTVKDESSTPTGQMNSSAIEVGDRRLVSGNLSSEGGSVFRDYTVSTSNNNELNLDNSADGLLSQGPLGGRSAKETTKDLRMGIAVVAIVLSLLTAGLYFKIVRRA